MAPATSSAIRTESASTIQRPADASHAISQNLIPRAEAIAAGIPRAAGVPNHSG
jgi:hypothetical protein